MIYRFTGRRQYIIVCNVVYNLYNTHSYVYSWFVAWNDYTYQSRRILISISNVWHELCSVQFSFVASFPCNKGSLVVSIEGSVERDRGKKPNLIWWEAEVYLPDAQQVPLPLTPLPRPQKRSRSLQFPQWRPNRDLVDFAFWIYA